MYCKHFPMLFYSLHPVFSYSKVSKLHISFVCLFLQSVKNAFKKNSFLACWPYKNRTQAEVGPWIRQPTGHFATSVSMLQGRSLCIQLFPSFEPFPLDNFPGMRLPDQWRAMFLMAPDLYCCTIKLCQPSHLWTYKLLKTSPAFGIISLHFMLV